MSRRRQITLELDLGSEPITGSLQGEDGTIVPFAGWLQLAAAIERCTSEPGEGNSGPGPSDAGG